MITSLINSNIVQRAALHCRSLLSRFLPTDLFFHNLEHTQEVVLACQLIARESDLPRKEMELLIIAAWFHDTGYILDYNAHEQYSEQIARNWLAQTGLTSLDKDKIISCIRATQMPQRPHTLLEEILCDADLIHLSTEAYENKAKLLHKEWKCVRGLNLSPKEWMINNIDFLTNHQYFTLYGQRTLEVRKEKNISTLLAALSPV
ncbi:MAG: HD domain-containing protein [Saprospiraceae bacterium]|nr:HD domain-containing protein [Saprospiraceae bacterium]